ncbi:sulfotransferase 1B1-like [Oppia nitens]|uniref:sulfotransferase 1B1-like n=1 Tax=Oppia nitens TaxID=1686743 RepID=UPI0023DA9B1E|nr:sulfotransferase 1B1-like [Oppia nitens]
MFLAKLLSECPAKSWLHKNTVKNNTSVQLAANDPNIDNDTQRAQYVRSIPNALLYNDLLLQGYLVNRNFLTKINNFEIRENDIWLATYPKSGTTWTEEILSLICNKGDIDKVKDKLLPKRVVHFEVGRPVGHSKWLKKLKSPRLIATHLPVTHIPNQLKQTKCKIIYVVRNPKDTSVSFYHHHRMSSFLGNYDWSWDIYVDLFLKGQLVYGDWLSHVEGYWQLHKQYPNRVLFVSYEELKTDLPKMIALIARFVGQPLSDEIIQRIANHCSFDEMKSNKMVNREKLPIFANGLFDMTETKFMRKGIIGDWRTHFTDEQSDRFDKHYNKQLNDLGIHIAYDSQEAQQLMQPFGRIIYGNKDQTELSNVYNIL